MRRLMFVFIILALVLQAPKSYSATDPANYCYVPPFAGNMVECKSGATVATLSSRYQSSAIIVQPAFYPEFQGSEKKLQWIGILRGYWVDTFGKFREDTVHNQYPDKVLQIFGQFVDRVFSFFFGANNEPKVALFNGDPDKNASICSNAQITEPNRLSPTIEFDCRLANNYPDDNNNTSNPWSGRDIRYIVDQNTIKDFTVDYWQDLQSVWQNAWGVSLTEDNTKSIIRYLRGMIWGYNYDYTYTSRNNLIDLQSICPSYYSGERVWKLGSIVYSTPAIVGNEPLNIKYIVVYEDETYAGHAESPQYKDRISMAFVGTNQGLLHSFRVGYLRDTGNSWAPADLTNSPNDGGKDRVGREEFALIPRNALPYMLQYGNQGACGAGAYIPILDYRLDAFDASFWSGYSPTDQKTQNSWRTYLLVPMGLGGKAIPENNPVASSSVLLLDITKHLLNPSTPPQLVWEFRLPDNTLTTAYPARVRIGDRNQNGYWYIVMGSGPKDPYADSHDKFVKKPKLYIIDPSKPNNLLINTIDLSPSLVPSDVNAAVGDIRVFDLDDDYQDDVIYFGMYGYSSNGKVWGGLFRIALKDTSGNYKRLENLSTSDVKKVLDLDSFAEDGNTPPVFAGVSAAIDNNGDLWVYVNTGLFLSTNHKNISYSNYLIGFKDPCWVLSDPNKGFNTSCTATVSKSQLADSKILSNYTDKFSRQQCTDNDLKFTQAKTKKQCVCSQNGCSQQDIIISTNARIERCICCEPPLPNQKKGWYYKLYDDNTNRKGIAYTRPMVASGVVLAPYFEPVDDPCQAGGKTYTLALNYKTGLPFSKPSLVIPQNVENNKLVYRMFLGYGAPPLGEMFRFIRNRLIGQTSSGALINVEFNKPGRFVLWIEK